MLRIAVCDDEAFYCEDLIRSITYSIHDEASVYGFDSGIDLIKAQKETPFDIAFLDIEMPGLSGIKTAAQLKSISRDLIVIFVSNHQQYVFDAFSVEAFRYLLKPVSQKKLQSELFLALEKYRSLHAVYTLQGRIQTALPIKDILYLEIRGHVLLIHLWAQKTLYCKGKLNDEERRLTSHGFIRCHKSYLVNPKYIREIAKLSIRLQNGEDVPISKKKRPEVMKRFQEFLARYAI